MSEAEDREPDELCLHQDNNIPENNQEVTEEPSCPARGRKEKKRTRADDSL